MLLAGWLLLACSSSCWADFLQSTLERIQQERLDTVLDLNQTDHNSDFTGKIIFDSDDSIEPTPEDAYDVNIDNAIPDYDQMQYSSPPPQHQTDHQQDSSAQGVKEGEVQGYYYYFYPLNNYLQNIQMQHQQKLQPYLPYQQPQQPMQQQMQQQMHQETPLMMSDSDMIQMMMMESMMKNSMMTKSENKVTPLFKAMTWFIGTALVFVVSILLMPRFRVKKAKEVLHFRDYKDTVAPPLPSVFKTLRAQHCSKSKTK